MKKYLDVSYETSAMVTADKETRGWSWSLLTKGWKGWPEKSEPGSQRIRAQSTLSAIALLGNN